MSDAVRGPCVCQSMVSTLEACDKPFPLGKSNLVSAAAGSAAFDQLIQGYASMPGLKYTTRCVKNSSFVPNEYSTDHCMPKRNSRSPQVTYMRDGVLSIL